MSKEEKRMDPFLKDKLDEINNRYFRMDGLPAIKWSKGSLKRKYRKITFGSYDFKKDQIRVHPVLKDQNVPGIVLEYVLFHELLHYQDREALQEGHTSFRLFRRRRVRVHTSDFHKREKEYPFKKEASRIMRCIAGGTFRGEPEPKETLFETAV